MHLTLKQEATKPAAANVLQQQARFDAFIDRYNHERPHQALPVIKVPADVYTHSPRPYRGLEELVYPLRLDRYYYPLWPVYRHRHKINVSAGVCRTASGPCQASDRIWLVSFMDYDFSAIFDDETCRLEPIPESLCREGYRSSLNNLLPIRPE